jgi:sugar phosphate isomerase/epimerase
MGATHAAIREQVGARPLDGRLGLNVPSGWWPSAATLKSYEAAGFGWVQVHSPPTQVLRAHDGDQTPVLRHAAAVRAALDTTTLRLVLHAPDTLMAGDEHADLALAALLEYAARAGAEHVVYHGMNVAPRAVMALRAEEQSLSALARHARDAGVTIAVENLAPVHAVPRSPRACHDPAAVAGLVARVGADRVRMCVDVGHAHIVGAALDVEPEAVALFHVHDNLGARLGGDPQPTLDPLRLDLHLPPGAGSIAWDEVAPLLAAAPHAPVQLEVHPPHRPEPAGLASVTAALLSGASAA